MINHWLILSETLKDLKDDIKSEIKDTRKDLDDKIYKGHRRYTK